MPDFVPTKHAIIAQLFIKWQGVSDSYYYITTLFCPFLNIKKVQVLTSSTCFELDYAAGQSLIWF